MGNIFLPMTTIMEVTIIAATIAWLFENIQEYCQVSWDLKYICWVYALYSWFQWLHIKTKMTGNIVYERMNKVVLHLFISNFSNNKYCFKLHYLKINISKMMTGHFNAMTLYCFLLIIVCWELLKWCLQLCCIKILSKNGIMFCILI